MSPMSRGRKSKKQKKAQKSRKRATTKVIRPAPGDGSPVRESEQLSASREPPEWFGPSIARVLGQVDAIVSAASPRELEQVTAELTGAELHRALREERTGLWFEWWFDELAGAAAEQVRAESDAGTWQAPWRLLHGLASVGSPALRGIAVQAAGDARKALSPEQLAGQPDWLGLCPDAAVTGGLWVMRDDYGTRFAVLAEYGYPGGVDPSVFLFDIDACGLITLASAGVFDSVDEAVTAWREGKGDAADGAQPEPVAGYDQLTCLVYCDIGSEFFHGNEPRPFTDNFFRANRRAHDIAVVLERQGQRWPQTRNLYQDLAIEPAVKAFSAWYARRHESEPHEEAVRWLAGDWLEGKLPGTEHAVSPHRVADLLQYMDDDWLPGEPVTIAARALLPEWVRWNGAEAGIRAGLIERSAAVAAGEPWNTDECPAFMF
ncbi:MAG: hypothetical protein JO345_18960 [Streptosporangiaceae bacterium]|nr:hypothetical protein [Streptosporangiaceae bacterium]